MSKTLHNAIVIKAMVMGGLAVALLVPPEAQAAAAFAANMLWLWRT